jgi:hypothetical protein
MKKYMIEINKKWVLNGPCMCFFEHQKRENRCKFNKRNDILNFNKKLKDLFY